MMKRICFFLFFILSFKLIALEYIITSSELNSSVAKKFPIERSMLFSKFIFKKPNLVIEKSSNMILFSCEVMNNALVLKDEKYSFLKIYAKAAIRYDSKDIYLKDIKILHIYHKNLSPKIEKKLISTTEILLKLYFSKKPIYKIENGNLTMQILNKAICDIVIEDGVIKVKI